MNCSINLGRVAGLLYLSLIPLGIFGILYVPQVLIVETDAFKTANNIAASEFIFRLSILSAFLVQIINIAVVLVLYKVLSPIHKTFAKLMVLFIFIGVPIAMLNELNHMAVLLLLDTTFVDATEVLSNTQTSTLILFFLNLHESGIYIASVFWGLWLFPMAYLVYRSNYIPKIIGILLFIASFGYVIDTVIFFLFPSIDLVLSEYTFIGEVVFPLWLLIKGSKSKDEVLALIHNSH